MLHSEHTCKRKEQMSFYQYFTTLIITKYGFNSLTLLLLVTHSLLLIKSWFSILLFVCKLYQHVIKKFQHLLFAKLVTQPPCTLALPILRMKACNWVLLPKITIIMWFCCTSESPRLKNLPRPPNISVENNYSHCPVPLCFQTQTRG